MRFKNKDELLKKLEEREESLILKKKEVKYLINKLEAAGNIKHSGDFRFKLSHAVTELYKTIANLHKLDMDIDSELIRLYTKAIDIIHREEKMQVEKETSIASREELEELKKILLKDK